MQYDTAVKELLEYSQKHNFFYKSFVNVFPKGIYQDYSTIFMTAMHIDFEWMYHGEVPEKINDIISLGTCIRTDGGFSREVSSDRHLKTFEMLMCSSGRSYEECIPEIVGLIKELLQDRGQVYARVHPSDCVSQTILSKNKVPFKTEKDCIFVGTKHQSNRSGYRIEFCAKGVLPSGKMIDWELMNAVLIDAVDGVPLKKTFVDCAGCFERFLVFREGKDCVLETSSFDLKKMEQLLPKLSDTVLFTFMDLVRTAVVMSLSGYSECVKQSRQGKTFNALETNLANFTVLNGLSYKNIKLAMDNDFKLVCERKNLTDKEFEYYIKAISRIEEKIMQKENVYNKICNYLIQNNNMSLDVLAQKTAQKYNGGDLNFINKIIKNISLKKGR